MDKLAERLRLDAEAIDAPISEELDRRITASLHAAETESPATPVLRRRPALFWWASSLTGVAAAVAVIAVLNSFPPSAVPEGEVAGPTNQHSPVVELQTPLVEWNTEAAILTAPLRDELDKLQSDIKKAEQRVKQDIGL